MSRLVRCSDTFGTSTSRRENHPDTFSLHLFPFPWVWIPGRRGSLGTQATFSVCTAGSSDVGSPTADRLAQANTIIVATVLPTDMAFPSPVWVAPRRPVALHRANHNNIVYQTVRFGHKALPPDSVVSKRARLESYGETCAPFARIFWRRRRRAMGSGRCLAGRGSRRPAGTQAATWVAGPPA